MIPDDALAAYDRIIATVPGLERKGPTMPYTSLNGNMFSFLADTGVLALRLSASDRDAFIDGFGATLYVAHGRPMKEYVSVPPYLLADTAALAPWFARSWDYAQT